MSKYVPVIGLEIHVELSTVSKMFCGCPADWFGKEPNIHTCPVCLGMPGALPVPNHQAVESTILLAQALGCTINNHSKFDRKHYFYPDLPKGYQISQYDEPIGIEGNLSIVSSPTRSGIQLDSRVRENDKANNKTVRIRRVHLEEDAGKLMHEGGDTLVDFDRAGVPLVEIVTEPDFDNSDDVKKFLEELQVIVRYLGVSDGDMEKGSMRLEPNISVKNVKAQMSNVKDDLPNYKVEVKNINSFRFAKAAIDYEVTRHQVILKKGETPVQETRGWDSVHKRTVSQRSKEEAHDYRYFTEPDIPPMEFSESELSRIRQELPELPASRISRYIKEHEIRPQDAQILTRNKEFSDKIDYVLANRGEITGQSIANYFVNFKPDQSVSEEMMLESVRKSSQLKENIGKIIDEEVIKKVITDNPEAVTDYKSGKENVINVLVGAVMKELKGQADAIIVAEQIKINLKDL